MEKIDLEHAKKVMLNAAGLASARLLDRYGSTLNIESKGRADFVTELDKECEEIIQTELASFDDTIAFMGEESAKFEIDGDKLNIDIPSTCFIVDPLDGTSNYMHSFNGYCVSIGLRVDNEVVVGVVYVPTLGDVYTGVQGGGSYRSKVDGSNELKLKAIDDGDDRIIFAAPPPFRHPEYVQKYLERMHLLYTHFEDMRRVGSAALDLSWTAQGSFGVYIEQFLKPWDVCAGAVILREAGGIISDWQGNQSDWLYNGQICATGSARLHEKVLGLLEY